MPKQFAITVDDALYAELVRRAGGPRKLSKYLNPLLRDMLSAANDLDLQRQISELRARLTALETQHDHAA